MAESIEPKTGLGNRIVSVVLRLALIAVVGYGAYSLMFGERTRETISLSELRKAIRDHRENRRQGMIQEVREMRSHLAEMRQIRNHWRREAGVEADFDAVLTEQEQQHRAEAKRPLDDMPLHAVYDTARAVEQDMITMYREFLAARQMGLGQGLTYPEAYEQAATPRPNRPVLDTDALYRRMTSTREDEARQALLDEVRRSVIEVREMLENSEKLLAFTRKSNRMAGDGISVDLSEEDAAMLGYRGPELMPDEMDFTYEGDVGNFSAVPGRRLVTGGRMDEWMYVDTWYIIGPFPGDPRRESLDVRFGPEANVNLDDVFTGKDGQKLRWRFKKTGWVRPTEQKVAHWKIEPPEVYDDAIYYAWTEIYSDAPREVWIATGTDDYGKLWINDELVWKSPTTRKPYNATENIQSVNLEQGHNKVLYRVENGGGTMGWSLMVRLDTGG